MKSTMWTLKARDWFKGLIIAVGMPVLTLLQQLIPSWTPWLTEHFGQTGGLIFQGAIAAFTTYMLKQLATDDVKAAEKVITQAKADEIKSSIETERKF